MFGGHILYVCDFSGGVCVHSMYGLHVVWVCSCWDLCVMCVAVCVYVWGGYFSFKSLLGKFDCMF